MRSAPTVDRTGVKLRFGVDGGCFVGRDDSRASQLFLTLKIPVSDRPE
jgi:hypothetical protein